MRDVKVDDKALIPIGLAVLVFGGGAAWLTTIHSKVEASVQKIEKVEIRLDKRDEKLDVIQKDIAEIKGELKRIKR